MFLAGSSLYWARQNFGNFDYFPVYSLCTGNTGFLSFTVFNLWFTHARIHLILPCVCDTVLLRNWRSQAFLQSLIDT